MDEPKLTLEQAIRERLVNPFIFSFIISEILYNWKIPVALIWHNPLNIKESGYNSLFDLITSQIQSDGSFYYPFIASIIITLGVPLLRIIFTTFNAAVTRLGNFLFFQVSKKSNISTSRYLQLREKYLLSLDKLEKVIKAEGDYELKFRESQMKQAALQVDSDVLNKMIDERFVEGGWEITYTQSNKKTSLRIMGGIVQVTEPNKDGGQTIFPNDNLSFFMRDVRGTERLIFQIRHNDTNNVNLITYNLSKVGEGRYSGYENMVDQVTMTKIS